MRFPRKNKYGAKRVKHAGYSFASKAEARRFDSLKLLERAGEIKILQCQDHVYLTKARILYIPDFKVQDVKTGEIYWVEEKGYSCPVFQIKKRLWKAGYGPGRLEIYYGSKKKEIINSDRSLWKE